MAWARDGREGRPAVLDRDRYREPGRGAPRRRATTIPASATTTKGRRRGWAGTPARACDEAEPAPRVGDAGQGGDRDARRGGRPHQGRAGGGEHHEAGQDDPHRRPGRPVRATTTAETDRSVHEDGRHDQDGDGDEEQPRQRDDRRSRTIEHRERQQHHGDDRDEPGGAAKLVAERGAGHGARPGGPDQGGDEQAAEHDERGRPNANATHELWYTSSQRRSWKTSNGVGAAAWGASGAAPAGPNRATSSASSAQGPAARTISSGWSRSRGGRLARSGSAVPSQFAGWLPRPGQRAGRVAAGPPRRRAGSSCAAHSGAA